MSKLAERIKSTVAALERAQRVSAAIKKQVQTQAQIKAATEKALRELAE